MITLFLHILLLLFKLAVSPDLESQDLKNQAVVKQIYKVLQDKNTTSQEIEDLMPDMRWEEIKTSASE